jgi:hypothetical protein
MTGRGLIRFLSVAIILIASSCATPPIPVSYPEAGQQFVWPSEELKEAFVTYWTLRSKRDYQASFKMEAPYIQEVAPMPIYRTIAASEKVAIERLALLDIQWENDAYYTVGMNLHFARRDGIPSHVYVGDRWVKAGNRWYHVIKDPIFQKFFP